MAAKKQVKSEQLGGSSFLTGLTVGLFAGAFGYYLFNTKNGEKMRTSLATEWDEIRKKMYAEGLLPSATISLSEVLSDHLSTLSEWFGKIAEIEQTANKKKNTSTDQPERFKGVK